MPNNTGDPYYLPFPEGTDPVDVAGDIKKLAQKTHVELGDVDERIDNINGGGSGTPGPQGDSAYEVAVNNGFSGSEEEWLESLQGADGLNGNDGADGLNGNDGADGLNGNDGADGLNGNDGAAATITVGSTTTGNPGDDAAVSNSGTTSAAVLNFTIPKGEKGDQGAGVTIKGNADWTVIDSLLDQEIGDLWILAADSSEAPGFDNESRDAQQGDGIIWGGAGWDNVGPIRGPQGDSGTNATVGVVDTTTGEPGTSAEVVDLDSGNPNNLSLSFIIPSGIQGEKGDDASFPADGNDGEFLTLQGGEPVWDSIPVVDESDINVFLEQYLTENNYVDESTLLIAIDGVLPSDGSQDEVLSWDNANGPTWVPLPDFVDQSGLDILLEEYYTKVEIDNNFVDQSELQVIIDNLQGALPEDGENGDYLVWNNGPVWEPQPDLSGFVDQSWLEENYYDQSEINDIIDTISGSLPVGAEDGDVLSWTGGSAEWIPGLPEYGNDEETNSKYLYNNDGTLIWQEVSSSNDEGLPPGGDINDVLVKTSGNNFEAGWDKIDVQRNITAGDDSTYLRNISDGGSVVPSWVFPTFDTQDGLPADPTAANAPNVIYDEGTQLTYYKNGDGEYQPVGSLI